MATQKDTIEMAALGRPLHLGTLYDCRSDKIVPGIILWGPDTLRNHVDKKRQPKTTVQAITSDSVAEKASSLEVSASLTVGVLAGLVKVGGSAKYLEDTKRSKRHARVTLHYYATTEHERLTMTHLGRENVAYPDVVDQGTATHVVTAVTYGAQAFFVFDRDVSETENVQSIEAALHAMIQKIPQVTVEAEGSIKRSEKERQFEEKVTCMFHGDFCLETNPVTYQDALKTYATLPKILGESAVPMIVWLYPLTKIDPRSPKLVHDVSLKLIFDAQTALDHLTEVDMRCSDLAKDPSATSFPEIKKKIQRLQNLCMQHRETFRQELAHLLPAIRGGEKEEGALVDILTRQKLSPFSGQTLAEFLRKKERESIFVKSYLSMLKDVEVISSQNQLAEIALDSTKIVVVSFTFTSLQDEEPYLAELENWLQRPFKGDSLEAKPVLPGKQDSKLWFEDEVNKQKMRRAAKLLSEVARVNSANGKTRFTVSSVHDVNNPGASVYLYEEGRLISTDYELPSKPLPPLIAGIEHNSVQLRFNPAAYGRSAISSYQVEYRIVGQETESWMSVNTEGSEETFTVEGLHPNTEYQFRYSSMSKPGRSQSSDESQGKTRPTSPPGKPNVLSVNSSTASITLENPDDIGMGAIIQEYKVEYREEVEDVAGKGKDEWNEQRTGGKKTFYQIDSLRPKAAYRFRVSAVCMDGALSAPSKEIEIATPPDEGPEKLIHKYIQDSTPIRSGQLPLYGLPLEKATSDAFTACQIYQLGKENVLAQSKVVLMVGASESGKTTLINGMINRILGVKWEDPFRFKLIHETTKSSQGKSQAAGVRAYVVNHQKGFQIPYSLTLIDTPGCEGMRRVKQGQLLAKQIWELFSTSGCVDHIDAICFVVRGPTPCLSDAQKHVFATILSIWGEDIKDNIQVLVTFADGQKPPVLEAIQKAAVPCAKDATGTPVHFQFNHSSLFANNACHSLPELFWDLSTRNTKAFFYHLDTMKPKPKSLSLTQDVLVERDRLEAVLGQTLALAQAALVKLGELRKTQTVLVQHKHDLDTHQDFEYEVEKTVLVQISTAGINRFHIECMKCQQICTHFAISSFNIPDFFLNIIRRYTRSCESCPGHCDWYLHCILDHQFEYQVINERRAYAEWKQSLERACGGAAMMSPDKVHGRLAQEYEAVQEAFGGLVQKAFESFQQLKKIALKPDLQSTLEFIDLFIVSEEQDRKPGFEGRIQLLMEMKEAEAMIKKTANKAPL